MNGNKNIRTESRKINSDNYGFTYDTTLQLKNGLFKNICDIKVGDILKNNGTVLGIMKLNKNNDTTLYKIKNSNSTKNHLIVAGTTFMNNRGEWDCAYRCDRLEPIKNMTL